MDYVFFVKKRFIALFICEIDFIKGEIIEGERDEIVTEKEILLVSLMLFSMFFGAGNLIFPPFLGYEAGEHVWISLVGFIISATGLPILGVIAIAKAGSFQTLAGRVHSSFAIIFPCIVYVFIDQALAFRVQEVSLLRWDRVSYSRKQVA